MMGMGVMLKRNFKLFFRDKVNLFLSLLAIFIIIGLYVLFLGGVWGDEDIRAMPGADILRNSWLTAGILAVSTVTKSMAAFGVIMDDRVKKIDKGFYASPIKRSYITGGYILNAVAVGMLMTVITFAALSVYIIAIGGAPLSFAAYAKTLGIILLSCLCGTAIVCFFISFIKSRNAFNTANTILGASIGFLMGIYLPIGTLPQSVQTVIRLFPPSHAAMLLRRVIMETPIQTSFENVPVKYLEGFKEAMGVVYHFGNFEVTPIVSVLFLAVTAAVFFGLSLLGMRKMAK